MTSGRGSICSIQTTPERLRDRDSTSACGLLGRAPGCRPRRRTGSAARPGRTPAAARSRWVTPFCRVTRPTKIADGRSGRCRTARRPRSAPPARYSVGVDAVVDHVHPGRVEERVRGEHVGAHRAPTPRSPRPRSRRPAARPRTRSGSRRRAARPSTAGPARASARSGRAGAPCSRPPSTPARLAYQVCECSRSARLADERGRHLEVDRRASAGPGWPRASAAGGR